MAKIARVITTTGINDYYHYSADESFIVGTVVSVGFGRKRVSGVIAGYDDKSEVPEGKLKPILGAYPDVKPVSREMLHFIDWACEYNMIYRPQLLKMVLNVDLDKKRSPSPVYEPAVARKHIRLNAEQRAAADYLSARLEGFNATLINGVTGSGKTEVYLEAVRKVVNVGKQVLILMPEIALTAAFMERFEGYFGFRPCEWHSDVREKAKREIWHGAHDGSVKVVVGARSALFLPFDNLGLIVVDEEHDGSYKQDENVIYHARDMAVVRANIEKIPLILTSATPSLETMVNVSSGKYGEVVLKKRYYEVLMPEISLVDMKGVKPAKVGNGKGFISPVLLEEIRRNLESKEQSLLVLNRKGYAPLEVCTACGHKQSCPKCSAWLVEHRKDGRLRCHQCGYSKAMSNVCPSCKEKDSFVACGPGIERVEAEILHHFPDARVKVLSADNLNHKNAASEIAGIASAGNDIIIGTQVLSKGHHFPELTLVGVIDADMGLEGGDLRAMEKTYQMLGQVAGRAGRQNKRGRVFLQTYFPDSLIMKSLVGGDACEFYALEEEARRNAGMPPFVSMAAITVSAKAADIALKTASVIAKTLSCGETGVLGPAPASVFRVNNRYRYKIIIKAGKAFRLGRFIKFKLQSLKIPSQARIKADVNPYNFL